EAQQEQERVREIADSLSQLPQQQNDARRQLNEIERRLGAAGGASRGLFIWGPDSGSQACGDVGPGRMLDPLVIVDKAAAHFAAV
ncbi:hypothetical protein MJI95_37525, partial [Salmonella enterica subsp. enterica serovar Kentucky]|nr:hypothetical protein [Salmonella enterica subsp. enterica serovar Kentucky]